MMRLIGLFLLVISPVTTVLICEPSPLCIGEECPRLSSVWVSDGTMLAVLSNNQTHLQVFMDDMPMQSIALPEQLHDTPFFLGLAYLDVSQTFVLFSNSPAELYQATLADGMFRRVDLPASIEGVMTLCNGLYGTAFLSTGEHVLFCTSDIGNWPLGTHRIYRWNPTDNGLIYTHEGHLWRSVVVGLDGNLVIQDSRYVDSITRLRVDMEPVETTVISLSGQLNHPIGRLEGVDEHGMMYFITVDNPPSGEYVNIAKFTRDGALLWEVETDEFPSVAQWLGEDQFLARSWMQVGREWQASRCDIRFDEVGVGE
jgi:hypothetical protein